MNKLVIRLYADHPYRIAGAQRFRIERGGLDGRIADGRRIVGDDGEIMQRMHLHDLGINLERTRERNRNVADCYRHGVAVHDHVTTLRVDHETGAVVMTIRYARNRVGQIEGHYNQRRRNRSSSRVIVSIKACAAGHG